MSDTITWFLFDFAAMVDNDEWDEVVFQHPPPATTKTHDDHSFVQDEWDDDLPSLEDLPLRQENSFDDDSSMFEFQFQEDEWESDLHHDDTNTETGHDPLLIQDSWDDVCNLAKNVVHLLHRPGVER